MNSLGFLLAIAFSVASCTAQDASTSGTVTNSDGKDIEGPIEMTANEINFPQDHCFHTNQNEWVYFSGTVETSRGKEFGLMFTIFQFTGFGGRFTYPSMLGISDPSRASMPNSK
jgi:predicted secreted hydrolase